MLFDFLLSLGPLSSNKNVYITTSIFCSKNSDKFEQKHRELFLYTYCFSALVLTYVLIFVFLEKSGSVVFQPKATLQKNLHKPEI